MLCRLNKMYLQAEFAGDHSFWPTSRLIPVCKHGGGRVFWGVVGMGPTQITGAILSASDRLSHQGRPSGMLCWKDNFITLTLGAPGDVKEQGSSRKHGLQDVPCRGSSRGRLRALRALHPCLSISSLLFVPCHTHHPSSMKSVPGLLSRTYKWLSGRSFGSWELSLADEVQGFPIANTCLESNGQILFFFFF